MTPSFSIVPSLFSFLSRTVAFRWRLSSLRMALCCSLIIAHSILVIGNNCLCRKEQMVLSLVPLVTSKSFLQDSIPKVPVASLPHIEYS
ncbi:hypothetical protein C8J56DRAFT_1062301 [Mycena floridula]|nr:hypothetical protein C8J56DRAFT_1062301 [Mycena floridula]